MSGMRFIFALTLMLCGPIFAGSNDVSKAGEKVLKAASNTKIKAVKNDNSLKIVFYKGKKEIGAWPFRDSDGGSWDKGKTKITGMTTVYNDKGFIIGKGLYVDSMKQGKWMEYDRDGKLHGEYIYKDGNRNGGYKEYYQSGAVAEEGVFVSGTEYYYVKGNYKEFYPSGKLKAECSGAENHGEGSEVEHCPKEYPQAEKWQDRVGLDDTP